MNNKNNRWRDGREMEVIRIQAVKLFVKGYMKKKDICELLEISMTSLYERIRIHKEKWYRWLKAKSWKNKGRPEKVENKLTNKQKKILVRVISQEPRKTGKLMLNFGLWTIKYVQHAIKILFKKEMKEWKVREILIELWFSNQKPLFRAYQQNPEKVEKWLDEELPFILDEAEKEWRKVYYGDEAGFRSANHRWKTWAKKGKTPKVSATWARFWVNAVSIINPKWELRFMAYEWSFTSDTLIKFLKKVVYKTTSKITIILDGHPTHKTKKVKAFLESINHQVKIYLLPWYSPELNPDEQVWLHVHNDLKGVIVADKKELIAKVRQSLYRQQKQKDKVASYFRHPDVQWKSD